jgi:hypothetical protein
MRQHVCLAVGERGAALGADEGVAVSCGELGRPVAGVRPQAFRFAARYVQGHCDAAVIHVDEVVGRVWEATGAKGRDRPGVNEQHAGDGPDIGHVPVAGEDDVDLGLAKHAEHVSCVEYLVSLPTGSWNRQKW